MQRNSLPNWIISFQKYNSMTKDILMEMSYFITSFNIKMKSEGELCPNAFQFWNPNLKRQYPFLGSDPRNKLMRRVCNENDWEAELWFMSGGGRGGGNWPLKGLYQDWKESKWQLLWFGHLLPMACGSSLAPVKNSDALSIYQRSSANAFFFCCQSCSLAFLSTGLIF